MHQEPAQLELDDAPRLLLPGIMGAVGLFAVIVAGGVYGRTGKMLALPVVLGTVGAFLLMWYLAARRRAAGDPHDDAAGIAFPLTQATLVTSLAIILLAFGMAGFEGGVIQAIRKGVIWEPLAYAIFLPVLAVGSSLLLWGQRLSAKSHGNHPAVTDPTSQIPPRQ